MQTHHSILSYQKSRDRLKGRVAFVPTMGALHDGHYSLIDQARELAEHVVVSIFVNPTQFGPNEDLDRYPRTPEEDLAGCEQRGVELVLMPSAEEIYPPGQARVHMDFPELTGDLEGEGRPGHFQGVCEVCCKLFNIIRPDVACFGQKDYQQLVLIKTMVKALNMPLEIEGCPIIRETDGLAMSSRNRMLSAEARERALCLSRSLRWAGESLKKEPESYASIEQELQARVSNDADELCYGVIRNPETLQIWTPECGPKAVILSTAKFGGVRLLDNLVAEW